MSKRTERLADFLRFLASCENLPFSSLPGKFGHHDLAEIRNVHKPPANDLRCLLQIWIFHGILSLCL